MTFCLLRYREYIRLDIMTLRDLDLNPLVKVSFEPAKRDDPKHSITLECSCPKNTNNKACILQDLAIPICPAHSISQH